MKLGLFALLTYVFIFSSAQNCHADDMLIMKAEQTALLNLITDQYKKLHRSDISLQTMKRTAKKSPSKGLSQNINLYERDIQAFNEQLKILKDRVRSISTKIKNAALRTSKK